MLAGSVSVEVTFCPQMTEGVNILRVIYKDIHLTHLIHEASPPRNPSST